MNDRSGHGDVQADEIGRIVREVLAAQPIVDIHTHLYPPTFGTPLAGAGRAADASGLCLWGIDELLTYHYLVAEVFRVVPASVLPYERFWSMSRREQADHIWRNLFIERSPVSEACRGVLTVVQRLGLNPSDRDLDKWRKYFAEQEIDGHIDRCMELANVTSLTMTNNVFDDNERGRWLADSAIGDDPRFRAVLRIDPILGGWPGAARRLREWGYAVELDRGGRTIDEVRRFLREWIGRMKAIYLAVSLRPTWKYTEYGGNVILDRAVLPVCAEFGMPLAMMIGARRAVNPGLASGGDASGLTDVALVEHLCRRSPGNRFLVTMLARENQHELCVAARKFGNLMIFGCWWFLNIPSLIDEITRMRLELLGTSFIPQHSDARVLEQIVYKWEHSKEVIAGALADQYGKLAATGWRMDRKEIERDVRLLMRENFLGFVKPVGPAD